ncbi:unnamed protein product [Auanema sp. JU1783]|nr:unnamed protein product [Auanema sp. JU1783]
MFRLIKLLTLPVLCSFFSIEKEDSFLAKLKSPFEILEEETLYHGVWANFTRIHFIRKGTGSRGAWELIDVSQYDSDRVNGIQLIPRIVIKGQRYFVLNLQYRIPLKAWTLEFPGGAVETGETNLQGALRELKEETGYTATEANSVFTTVGKLATHPGKTNDLIQITVIDIDSEIEENQHVLQNLDEAEASYVRLIPEHELFETLVRIQSQVHITSNVLTFALGYKLALEGVV